MSIVAPDKPRAAVSSPRRSGEGRNPASFARYPKYKDSGVEWLGEVPAHWNVTPLKRLLEFQNGTDHKPIETDEGYPVYGSGGIFAHATDYLYDGESVLFGRKGTVDRPLYVRGKFWTVDTMYWTRIRPGAHGKFCYYVATSIPFPYYSTNTALPSMTQGALGAHAIACPEESEQFTIAAFLDRETAKIDALIAEQEKLIALLKEKRQALISHAVTKGLDPNAPMKDSGIEWLGQVPAHWEIVQIRRLSVVKRGASPRPIDDPKYFDDDGKYAWVRISDVSSSDGVLAETTQRLSDLGSSLSVKLAPGSLFVSIAGTVGKPCITGIDACIHDGFVYFPTLKLDPKFLYRIFEAGRCYAGLGKFGTQLNLNTDTIGSISIAVPPKDEMREVLSQLDSLTGTLDSLVGQAECASGLLRERRAALISAAVTGKFDVRQMVGDVAA